MVNHYILTVLMLVKILIFCMYLDLQKTFDKVSHKLLICKLEAHCVNGDILKWIQNFLSNCRQRICVSGSASFWSTVISGVPQGSVLGPCINFILVLKYLINANNFQ